jgi:NADH:ubiquinone oxidoreductase subunit
MGLIRSLFIWWRDATLGTKLNTWINGVKVGSDGHGNRYYRSRDGKRRWVLYRGIIDASRVSADWHGWLHHNFDEPPEGSLASRPWEQDHRPNLSGTAGAYRPPGSLERGGVRAPAASDYQPWKPV